MNLQQWQTLCNAIAEIRFLSEDTEGQASVLLADLHHQAKEVAKKLERIIQP